MCTRLIKYRIIFLLVFTLLSSGLFSQKVDLYEGIISIYDFEGNANDASGNGNNGILHGPVLAQDRFGNTDQAYFFDGVDDYIEINPVSDVSEIGDFTIAAWANCNDWEIQPGISSGLLDYQYIFDGHSYSETTSSGYYRDGFSLIYSLKVNYSYYVVNHYKDIETTAYVKDIRLDGDALNTWHHIVYIRNGSQTKHYIDGVLIETNAINTSLLNMQHKWFIGTFSGNNPYYNRMHYNFCGLIDDIYIYNRAINACEVEALYSGYFPPER